jgi:hypothetical protein
MRSVNDSKMYLFNVSQCLTLSEPPEGRLALGPMGIAIGSIGQGIEPGHDAREVPGHLREGFGGASANLTGNSAYTLTRFYHYDPMLHVTTIFYPNAC